VYIISKTENVREDKIATEIRSGIIRKHFMFPWRTISAYK